MTDITNDTGRRWSDLSMKERFLVGWRQVGFDGADLTEEYRFCHGRRWAFDLAFPSLKVGVELDGIGYGHNSAAGRQKDNEKQNAAAELGWVVLRYGSSQLSITRMGDVVEQVCNVLAVRGSVAAQNAVLSGLDLEEVL